MSLSMPSVTVSFKEAGIQAIQRSKRGTILMILKEKKSHSDFNVYSVTDIPADVSDANKEQIKLALMGYQTSPRKVICITNTEDDYTEVLKKAESIKFDYLVIPEIAAEAVDTIASWVKSMRSVADKRVKAVLPNCAADSEGVINFTNTLIKTKVKTYTAAEYCARVAGIICGTPLTISCTYAPVSEVVEVETNTAAERDARVAAGEFFFYNDGEKIKVARGINSFVTTAEGKGDDFKKIKLVEAMDMIHDDIKETAHDSYIGKYANSYDNRCLLITAISGYLAQLEMEGILESGVNRAEIDLEATKTWLESNGLYTKDELADMTEAQIKRANVHDNVFVACTLSLLDAIENIRVSCEIQ